jgi:hypothetical protein
MRKILLFAFALTVSLHIQAQNTVNLKWITKIDANDEQVIHYRGSKKLVWDDFLGTANLPEPFAALTSTSFGYKANYRTKNGVTNFEIAIYCYFTKPKSWVKSGKKTAEILAHEQLHFDICYVFAKQFYDAVSKLNLQPKTMLEHINALYKSCGADMEAMQQAYDGETKHGTIAKKQAEWIEKIKLTLNPSGAAK